MTDFIKGEIMYFDKPLTWTSFDLVNKVRYNIKHELGLKKLKIGHAGTLDPLATGVLILCTGKMTKKIEELQYQTKEYIATVALGATTPSFDRETEIDATYPTGHITQQLVEETLLKFKGEIEQIPPAYSAVKIDGKRAYKYARKGEEVQLKPKVLVIDEIELLSFTPQEIVIRVVCSKGTYIRALARDIGQALNSGGYLTALRRTRIGDVKVEQCVTMEQFEQQLSCVKAQMALDGTLQTEKNN